MRTRAWKLACLLGFATVWGACGSNDDIAPIESDDAGSDGGPSRKDASTDTLHEAEGAVDDRSDVSVDATADGAEPEASADAAPSDHVDEVSPEVEPVEADARSADATPDASPDSDAGAPDLDAVGDVVEEPDVGSRQDADAGLPGADADAPGPDASPDQKAEASTDGRGDEPDAAHGDEPGNDADAGEAPGDARQDDGGEADGPELVHWTIEGRPECFANPSVVTSMDIGGIVQIEADTDCPTSNSSAIVWFLGSTLPAGGPYNVFAISSLADLAGLGPTDVAIEFDRVGPPVEKWWGQSGTVRVDVVGNRTIIQFAGVSAVNAVDHQVTTTLGAYLVATP
jgi:hypothetical protein